MTFQESFVETDGYDEEPPDAETILASCYWCGRTFDTGLTSLDGVVGELWCETCEDVG